jgi:carboxypeptidase T
MAVGRGGHEILDFPEKDKRFHNYAELTAELNGIQNRNRSLVKIVSIGKSLEGRDIWAIHINTDQESLKSNQSTKPGIIYLGAHHAREHLSAEIPLMFADYILAQSTDTKIEALLENRDIWIIPMVNPDGAEYDIASGSYKMWRKNRRKNKDSTYGVDLNRNYGYMWGGEGASDNPTSDVYRGPEAFSEPETQAVRDWIESHANLKTLLSLHTFSELILYPWGYTYDAITNQKDAQTFEKMAKTMATWNQYKPQQSSDLYITSGDTTDWAYGKHGIFAFTFELSPSSLGGGGFYPGAGVIDKVFEANIKPLLYLLDLTDDPYRALTAGPTGFLPHYVAPEVDPALHWGGSF